MTEIISNPQRKFEIVDLSLTAKKFIIEIFLKKSITAKTQSCFNSYYTYTNVLGILKHEGILEEKGKAKGGVEKYWILTKRGVQLAEVFLKMQEILGNKL